uniref:Lipase n=1 Tax=Syphacia muris TaxID=451379 RepID=A0A0N5AT77_9BILA
MMKQQFLILTVLIAPTLPLFTSDFASFIDKNFGIKIRKKLGRSDIGHDDRSSFGGKAFPSDRSKKTRWEQNKPVVFVHGVTLKAAAFRAHCHFFKLNGYTSADLYATTYGDGGTTSAMDTAVDCNFIKQMRDMFVAVYKYVGRKINVITWSMGSVISRKAILGGNCTETGERLGDPITYMVHTFLTVGGVNYGMQRCPRRMKACNSLNSMRCDSALMRYEGDRSFAIYGDRDTIVGRSCCGRVCGELKNANASFLKPHLNHICIFYKTLQLQYNLLNDG